MAAPTWAIVGTRLSAADATTGWDAGAISSDNPVVQGTGSLGQKISAATAGFGYTHGSTFDVSGADPRCMYLWMNCVSQIDTLANGGMRMRVGNDLSNYKEFYVAGNEEYSGGWRKRVVSPRATATTTVGSPDLTTVDYFAGFYKVLSSIMGSFNNAFVDALDLLEAIRMTDGDGTTPGTFARMQTFDTGTLANQYGVIRLASGVFFAQGRLYIGNGSTTTLFDDRSGAVVVFEDAEVDTDFYEIQLTASATLQLGELVSGAPVGGATILSSGPAWHLNLPAGTANLYGCTFGQYRIATLSSTVTADRCTFNEGGNIAALGANLSGSSILNSIAAADTSALTWNTATDPDGKLDDMLIQKGAAAHHAIEFGTTSPLTMTIRNMAFTGFNAANGNNDSTFHIKRTTGTVTINAIDVTGNLSYKTDGATVDIVTGTVTVKVTARDSASAAALQDVRVLLRRSTGATVTITRSGSTATVAHTAHGYATGQKVTILGANEGEYNGVKTVTVVDANSYTYTVSGTPATPATGTITSYRVILDGVTDVNGVIQDTGFVYTSDLAVTGSARRYTVAPSYKPSPLSGTIIATGFDQTAFMILD